MSYTSLFFDLDDTLLDFGLAEASAIRKVLSQNALPSDDETIKIYSEINKSFWQRFERNEIKREDIFVNRFSCLLGRLGISFDPNILSKEYFCALADGFFKVQYAEEILSYLKQKGYNLYATTNGVSFTQLRRIKGSGLEGFFDGIFISEDSGFQKPDKRYFDYVISKIPEKNKENILIIGDSQTSDILGGINSGISTCFFNPKGKEKKYDSAFEISSLLDLKKIL